VDLERFTPPATGRAEAVRAAARRRLGLPVTGQVIAFVGRIQPLKAPDILLRAVAGLPAHRRDDLTVAVVGGNSGSGLDLAGLAGWLGITRSVRFLPPQDRAALAEVYRAADLVAVPSYNESFGLVALEAQACGTPVVAAAVGGLVTAVRDGLSGVLVEGHDPADWAQVLDGLLAQPRRLVELSQGAVEHAGQFSWNRTAAGLLAVYRDAMAGYRALAPDQLAASL
jgi:D-inositol-3-phosphate glycosyltransferase